MARVIRSIVLFCSLALSGAVIQPLGVDVSCVVPECSTQEGRITLWPFSDPNFFIICEAPFWHLIRRPCLSAMLFHFERQECVDPEEWEKPCATQTPLPKCPVVVCANIEDQRLLWPVEDPSFFIQCVPRPDGGMMGVQRMCSEGYLFSYTQQNCIYAQYWEQDCTFDDITTIGTGTTEDDTLTSTTPIDTTTIDDSSTIDDLTTDDATTTTVDSTTTEDATTDDSTTTADATTTTDDLTTEDGTTTTEDSTTTEDGTTTTDDSTTTADVTTTPDAPTTETTDEPGRGICPTPECQFQDQNHYPHSDWTLFYVCEPNASGQWLPLVRPCGGGTYFHAGMQVCVHIWQWEDFCL
ncbi:uncharacterized protein LOC134214710 [Armigeres subalbatus]|uniref:uncharacterized protein LOC134214710 n=1 Tax=Armigeres subalbatus TaxID=124917 RepID=UPI002ED6A42A